jgi:hypothetical protein
MSNLMNGDKVKVVSGEYKGKKGVIDGFYAYLGVHKVSIRIGFFKKRLIATEEYCVKKI